MWTFTLAAASTCTCVCQQWNTNVCTCGKSLCGRSQNKGWCGEHVAHFLFYFLFSAELLDYARECIESLPSDYTLIILSKLKFLSLLKYCNTFFIACLLFGFKKFHFLNLCVCFLNAVHFFSSYLLFSVNKRKTTKNQ